MKLVKLRTESGGEVFVNPSRVETVTQGSPRNISWVYLIQADGADQVAFSVYGTPGEVANALADEVVDLVAEQQSVPA